MTGEQINVGRCPVHALSRPYQRIAASHLPFLPRLERSRAVSGAWGSTAPDTA